jgi:murein DD-endopeptidase MepM/ murein hydrolase activator NlpD
MALKYQAETRSRDEIAQQANALVPLNPAPNLAAPLPSPNEILNGAQRGALNAIKSSPVTDPNALRETASQAIGEGVSTFNTQIQNIQKQQQDLIGQITTFFDQSQTERNLTTKLNNLDTSFEMGQNEIEDKVIPMQFITGQLASNERRYIQQRNTLVRQLTSETASRAQKLQAAQFLYDASRNSLADTITLYQATKPENIGNVVDPETGEMTVIMQNPVTSEITKKNVGQVQTPAKWTQNRELAISEGVNQPFFTLDGRTIINTNSGREYSTPEQFFADGGSPDFSGVQKVTPLTEREQYNRQVFESDRTYEQREREIAQNIIESNRNFNQSVKEHAESMLLNSRQLTEDKDGNKVIVNLLDGSSRKILGNSYWDLYGKVTGMGSSLWANGVDADLKIGDPVYAPTSGTVIASAPNGGFGNQVKIRTDSGEEVWLSHLESGLVQVGQRVEAGQVVGVGGNTGNTIPGKGGDGSHLDFTVKRSDGNLMSAEEAHAWAEQVYENSQSKYDSEFEARVDYDKEIKDLSNDIAANDAMNPSEVIKILAKDYSKFISIQEIEDTIYRMYGVTPPSQAQQPVQRTTYPPNTVAQKHPGRRR